MVVEGGAEGDYTAIRPAFGFGVALKIDEGASGAAELTMFRALHQLDKLATEPRVILTDWHHPVQTKYSGNAAGTSRPTTAPKF